MTTLKRQLNLHVINDVILRLPEVVWWSLRDWHEIAGDRSRIIVGIAVPKWIHTAMHDWSCYLQGRRLVRCRVSSSSVQRLCKVLFRLGVQTNK